VVDISDLSRRPVDLWQTATLVEDPVDL